MLLNPKTATFHFPLFLFTNLNLDPLLLNGQIEQVSFFLLVMLESFIFVLLFVLLAC